MLTEEDEPCEIDYDRRRKQKLVTNVRLLFITKLNSCKGYNKYILGTANPHLLLQEYIKLMHDGSIHDNGKMVHRNKREYFLKA